MSITGDDRRLQQLVAKIASLASASARQAIARAVGAAARDLVDGEFRAAVDPYGRRWKATKRGHQQPLQGRRKIANSFRTSPAGDGFAITTTAGTIVKAHNEGADIPRRKVGGRELLFSPRTGRLISGARARRLKLVIVAVGRQASAGAFHLQRRQIIPEVYLGDRWGGAFNAAADQWLQAQFRST